MITFEKFNNNPKGKRHGDCVVRSISGASGKSWEEVYNSLCLIGFELKAMSNEKCVYEKYLNSLGYIKYSQPKKANNKKYCIYEIDNLIDNNTVIISLANHLTYCKDKIIFDIWDCTHKTVGNYWIKK